MIAFIQQHSTILALGSFWLFSNAVSAMPMPEPTSGKFYRWSFGFLHSMAGSIARAAAMKYGAAAQVPANQNGGTNAPTP